MAAKTLFLAWQDKARSRLWFPIGRLDADQGRHRFRFRYIQGADRAQQEAGFAPLVDFPDMHASYEASELFPLFKNRVIATGRPDFSDYMRQLDLPAGADPIEILSVDGGYRATDSFEVFPKLVRLPEGKFRCRFFLHGTRYLPAAAQSRLEALRPDERLHITLELTNPATHLALQVQTQDYFMIGWAPRYLVRDLARAIARATTPGRYAAKVIRINPMPAPSKQRLLVELEGDWPDFEPMTTEEFQPLAA
jgi:hypothetical protein